MSRLEYARLTPARIAVLFLSGVLIGGGAILPGISGGVLAVIFGFYRPMMELLAHPVKAVPKYWKMFVPVGFGWVIGFFGFAKLIELIFGANETVGTWLFIGLILGTIPQLYREAGEQGRTPSCFAAMGIAFAVVFGILLFVRIGTLPKVVPSPGWFIFCGVLWGLSLVVPGMSSSSPLMALGLLVPLTTAIAEFDIPVIGLWLLGLVGTVVILARVVNSLFERRYGIMYHIVVGVTIASTLIIIPLSYPDTKTVLLSALCCAAGVAIAYGLSRLEGLKDSAEEPQEDAEGKEKEN